MTYRIPRFLDRTALRYERLTHWILTKALTFGVRRLIIFLTPGYELRTGGILAIREMYVATIGLRGLHRARVALCIVPGDQPPLKYDWFTNDTYLLDLAISLKPYLAAGFLLPFSMIVILHRISLHWRPFIPLSRF